MKLRFFTKLIFTLILHNVKYIEMWSDALFNNPSRGFLKKENKKKHERDKLPVRRENERKLMRSSNCIIKEIGITSFRGRRVYRDMHIVICIHLSTDAFCTWPLRARYQQRVQSRLLHME